MVANSQVSQYLNNHYEGMDPKQLILLLYKGAIKRIRLAREGIEEGNIKKRGENLSKAIAIISELNASVDPKANDDVSQFLINLYTAILVELPKVSLDNDTEILDRTEAYILKLTEIWENEVMTKATPPKKTPMPGSYGAANEKNDFHSFAV
ncbi:MAG: flagellar export chaperone FliS [Desulfobacteraceae bacterium]|nr:flagellar export chaperone FliS [Desulfobacteraceae bacterium]